jgi:Putative phage metallopeptidase
MKKHKQDKKINFELIRDENHESYRLMTEIRGKYHQQLQPARIAIAWRKSLKPNVDGQLILGKCVKASDLNREAAPFDFIILLNREIWQDSDFNEKKKRALLDHELCHAEIVLDKETHEPKYDERGRNIWRIRKHDIEEFQAVIERHGCYKRDLERFANALLKKRETPTLPGFDAPQEKPERTVVVIGKKRTIPVVDPPPQPGANPV